MATIMFAKCGMCAFSSCTWDNLCHHWNLHHNHTEPRPQIFKCALCPPNDSKLEFKAGEDRELMEHLRKNHDWKPGDKKEQSDIDAVIICGCSYYFKKYY